MCVKLQKWCVWFQLRFLKGTHLRLLHVVRNQRSELDGTLCNHSSPFRSRTLIVTRARLDALQNVQGKHIYVIEMVVLRLQKQRFKFQRISCNYPGRFLLWLRKWIQMFRAVLLALHARLTCCRSSSSKTRLLKLCNMICSKSSRTLLVRGWQVESLVSHQ